MSAGSGDVTAVTSVLEHCELPFDRAAGRTGDYALALAVAGRPELPIHLWFHAQYGRTVTWIDGWCRAAAGALQALVAVNTSHLA